METIGWILFHLWSLIKKIIWVVILGTALLVLVGCGWLTYRLTRPSASAPPPTPTAPPVEIPAATPTAAPTITPAPTATPASTPTYAPPAGAPTAQAAPAALSCGNGQLMFPRLQNGPYAEIHIGNAADPQATYNVDLWWNGPRDMTGSGTTRVGTPGSGNTQIVFSLPMGVFSEIHFSGPQEGTAFRNCGWDNQTVYANSENYALNVVWNTHLASEGLNVFVAKFPEALENVMIRQLISCVTRVEGNSQDVHALQACSSR